MKRKNLVENQDRSALSWVYMFSLALIWGSSFILMKKGLESFTALQVAALRIGISGIILSGIFYKSILKIERKDWKFLLLAGMLGNLLPALLFTYAEKTMSSSLAGMLNSLTPLFTVTIGLAFFGSKIKTRQLLGVLLGFGGALIMLFQPGSLNIQSIIPALMVILATLFYGININLIRYRLSHLDSVTISAGALVFVTVPSLALLAFSGSQFLKSPIWPASLGYISILGIFGTAISLVYFNKLIKMAGPVFAASSTYIIPAVAILWGMSAGEKPGFQALEGLVVILAGVYLTRKN